MLYIVTHPSQTLCLVLMFYFNIWKNNTWGTIGAYDVYDRWKINDTIGFDYVYLDDYLLFEVDSNFYAIRHDRVAGDTLLVVAKPYPQFFSRSNGYIPEKEIQYKFFLWFRNCSFQGHNKYTFLL